MEQEQKVGMADHVADPRQTDPDVRLTKGLALARATPFLFPFECRPVPFESECFAIICFSVFLRWCFAMLARFLLLLRSYDFQLAGHLRTTDVPKSA